MAPATAAEVMPCEICDEPAYEWCGCCKAAFCHICDALVHKHSKRRSHVRVPISRENQLDKKENEEHQSASLSTEAGLVSRPPDTAAQRQEVTDMLDSPAVRQPGGPAKLHKGWTARVRQDYTWVEHARWFVERESELTVIDLCDDIIMRALEASRPSPDYTRSQQHVQHVLESALDSRWYLYRSALGQLHLYDSHLRISLPLSSGKHPERFGVLLLVNGQAMVVDVSSVEFLKNPPSTERARQVSLQLEDETAVMEKLREVLFTNSSRFPDLPCGFRPGKIYLHRLDRKKKVVVSSAAHANSQRDTVLVAPINELGTADINQITSVKKADLLPTSDDQYYDIARLLDDLDKKFFSALGPDPRQICTDLANMSLSNSTWTDRRKPPLGWLSEHTLQREVSSEVTSARAHLEYGPGHIPKSTTFLHTVDQRGLRQESRRLQTFVDWPQSAPVKPEDLAAAGFFYIGRGDNVQCFTCGNVLSHWREGDDPVREHFYRFPDCEFAIGYDVGNVPISSSLEPRLETVSSVREETSERDRLREEKMCKICMEEDAVIVFVSCGHLAVCQTCSATLRDCPICRKQIDGTVRVFKT